MTRARAKYKLQVRKNVFSNIQTFPKATMRKIWGIIKPLEHCSYRQIQSKLTHSLPVMAPDGQALYGAIAHKQFVIVLSAYAGKITVFSVVNNSKLKASKNKTKCDLLKKAHSTDDSFSKLHVFVDTNKKICWHLSVFFMENSEMVSVTVEGSTPNPYFDVRSSKMRYPTSNDNWVSVKKRYDQASATIIPFSTKTETHDQCPL